MNDPTLARGRRKPVVSLGDGVFHVEYRGRALDVPVFENDGEEDMLVELDTITQWTPKDDLSEAEDVSLEDLGDILEAIENLAEAEGLSVAFE